MRDRIRPSPFSVTTPYDSLDLIPHDDSHPIRLVARAQFRIGRSPDHSDWIARFQPETPENEILTNELGRVHVIGEVLGGVPTLLDGNGSEASINGSTFDGEPLTAGDATSITRCGVLTLGEFYAVDVIPLSSNADDFAIDGQTDLGSSQSDLRGAIVFAPRLLEPTLRDAAWIFTRLDFALRPSGGPAWVASARGNPAAFVRRDGRLWLANTNLNDDSLWVDDQCVTLGEAVPLVAGESLRLGAREYSIEIPVAS